MWFLVTVAIKTGRGLAAGESWSGRLHTYNVFTGHVRIFIPFRVPAGAVRVLPLCSARMIPAGFELRRKPGNGMQSCFPVRPHLAPGEGPGVKDKATSLPSTFPVFWLSTASVRRCARCPGSSGR